MEAAPLLWVGREDGSGLRERDMPTQESQRAELLRDEVAVTREARRHSIGENS